MEWLLTLGTSFSIAQWLFLKFLAFNYLLAFGSLIFQIKGLYGLQGITPIQMWLGAVERAQGRKPFWRIPTFFWFDASDKILQGTAIFGIITSLLIVTGTPYTPFLFFLLWLAYLSFVSAGSEFLSFQWDILLLELGFIGIFFSAQAPSSILFIALLWLVLFRFMLASGVVKLLAQAPEWRLLAAMSYHYETQPLPNMVAYYLHRLPTNIAKLSVLFTFFIELIVPFFIFGPSELRLIAFILFIFFQLLIMATGNYAFFNLLTIALCIPLLDNFYWKEIIGWSQFNPVLIPPLIVQYLLASIAIILIILNILQLATLFFYIPSLYRLLRFIGPYYIINSYGLFAHMTTKRPEIIIEGSEDGIHWKAYEFKWKPGDLYKPPKQVAPHQPRLDWQMWFAALGHYYEQPWFVNFLIRLLEGSDPVLKLLKTNPFPDKPPKFIRAHLYDYHFSSFKMRRETGQYWTRTFERVYIPSISLREIKSEDNL